LNAGLGRSPQGGGGNRAGFRSARTVIIVCCLLICGIGIGLKWWARACVNKEFTQDTAEWVAAALLRQTNYLAQALVRLKVLSNSGTLPASRASEVGEMENITVTCCLLSRYKVWSDDAWEGVAAAGEMVMTNCSDADVLAPQFGPNGTGRLRAVPQTDDDVISWMREIELLGFEDSRAEAQKAQR